MLLKRHSTGFSLIEMMVVVVILGVIASLAAPSFSQWITNRRIRTAAESVLSGLQMARAEAVRRNASVRFQLMSNAGPGCAPRATGPAWVVSRGAAAGLCSVSPSNTTSTPTAADPIIIASNGGAEASVDTQVIGADGRTLAVFDGLGRILSSTTATSLACIDIDVPTSTLPAADSRNLRIMISSGGQVRMCDPNVTADTRDPRYCDAANAGQNRCV